MSESEERSDEWKIVSVNYSDGWYTAVASLKPSFAPRFTLPPLVPSEAYEVNTLENVESIAQLTEAERDDGEANNRGQIRRN